MKIVVVGGTGLVGSEVAKLLGQEHDVITVGRTSGNMQADIEDKASVQTLFEKIGAVDAIISVAGDGVFGGFDEEGDHAYEQALQSKVMGQVNLTRVGHKYLNKGGSITLTSGAVAQHPMPNTAAIAIATAGVDAFVRTVALELVDDKRINSVSLSLVKESAEKFGMDRTHCVPAAKVAEYYRDVLGSSGSGQVVLVQN
ncbi:NAD(P)-dependent dehydrogenase, short-chain alcohol dehydrogenase family [Pseudovibrio ascidiaceicola]|uniref:NAD(P)-dependent dehydrogenase, short-chain alcohol dehydrogenase family n=1 Tax=Pseudovibrio ascidiaceicola TaxID=285279 RepID=A0A1I4F0F3_9HYPH|nr:short chain dehydrogenase [Pseudovibrio ascidiaceicola]SFL11465.1 NAD(P)-dependent dehydrogenase, short-chain alcohol dehydrogenase family [Pseudovibrio ascidiaceicola]